MKSSNSIQPANNLSVHLFLKDLRQTRLLTGVWFLLLLLELALSGIGLFEGDPKLQTVFGMICEFLAYAQPALLILLIVSVIHAEPLVGTNAFWLTRPIGAGQLLWAKLLYVALLVTTSVGASIIVLAANGATLPELLLAVPEQILIKLALPTMIVAVLASFTSGFGTFAIALVAATLGVALVASGIGSAKTFLEIAQPDISQSLLDSTHVAWRLLMVAGCAGILVYQYQTRRTMRSAVATVGLLLAVVMVQIFWNWDFMKRPFILDNQAGLTPAEVTVGIEAVTVVNSGVRKPKKQITSWLPITGAPPEYVLRIEEIDTKLFTASGEPVPTLSRGTVTRGGYTLPATDAVTAVLGGATLFNQPTTSTRPAGELFAVSDATFAEHSGTPLRLDTRFRMSAFRYEITAAMPPQIGERYDSGSCHLVVTDLSWEPGGVALLLHEREVRLRFAPLQERRQLSTAVFVLRNAKRGEAVLADRNQNEFTAATNLRFRLLRLSFTPKGEGKRSPDIDEEWLAEAELLRLELRQVAEFMHELQNDDFRMEIRKTGAKAVRKEIMEELAGITLPPDPTKDQVRDYVRQILQVSKPLSDPSSLDPQVAMLEKVGSEHLDVLIELKRKAGKPAIYLDAAILPLVREEDKALILGALRANPEFARIVLRHRWKADAREILLDESRLTVNSPAVWMRAVASLREPETFDALKDYFIRVKSGRRELYPALKKIPGFDLQTALAEAWKRAHYETTNELADLLIPLAESGNPEALEVAAELLADSGDYAKYYAREALKNHTAAEGTDDEMIAWYLANREKLIFNPETKRFFVQP